MSHHKRNFRLALVEITPIGSKKLIASMCTFSATNADLASGDFC